jgi:Cu(I)-responsive transcriptional regulator
MRATYSIGQLASQSGVKAETIRYYEKIGLLAPPARSAGNYRCYGARDVQRLDFVRRARELGFPLEQIQGLLALALDGEHDCATVDAAARAHVDAIERRIADLQALRQQLQELLRACPGGRVADCRVLRGLSRPR